MDQCPCSSSTSQDRRDATHLVLDESRMRARPSSPARHRERLQPYASRIREGPTGRSSRRPAHQRQTDADYLYGSAVPSLTTSVRSIATSLSASSRLPASTSDPRGEERCTGDRQPDRHEYLFRSARSRTSRCWRARVRRIVTSCPHCFNTFANEYRPRGHYEVIHHTELIDRLITSGRIVLERPIEETVTYHDSCYLGRWNDISRRRATSSNASRMRWWR